MYILMKRDICAKLFLLCQICGFMCNYNTITTIDLLSIQIDKYESNNGKNGRMVKMHCHWGRNVRPQFLQASRAFVLKSLKAWKKRKNILVIDFCKFVHNNKHNYVITLHYY